jgi:hypothetical protein
LPKCPTRRRQKPDLAEAALLSEGGDQPATQVVLGTLSPVRGAMTGTTAAVNHWHDAIAEVLVWALAQSFTLPRVDDVTCWWPGRWRKSLATSTTAFARRLAVQLPVR